MNTKFYGCFSLARRLRVALAVGFLHASFLIASAWDTTPQPGHWLLTFGLPRGTVVSTNLTFINFAGSWSNGFPEMGWAVDPNVINYNGDIWRTDVPVNKRYITTAQGAGGSLNHQSLILPNFLPSFANTNIHFVPIRSTNDGEIFGNDFSSSGVPQGQLQVGGFRFKFVLANDWRHTGVWFPVAAGSYQSNEIVTVSRNIYWHQATGEVLCFQSGSFKYSLNAGTNCWRTPAGVFTPTLNPFHACWFNWIFTASNQIPADLGGIYASVTSSHYSSNSPYAPLTTTNRFYPRWSDLSWYIATRHWTIWNANGFRQVLLP